MYTSKQSTKQFKEKLSHQQTIIPSILPIRFALHSQRTFANLHTKLTNLNLPQQHRAHSRFSHHSSNLYLADFNYQPLSPSNTNRTAQKPSPFHSVLSSISPYHYNSLRSSLQLLFRWQFSQQSLHYFSVFPLFLLSSPSTSLQCLSYPPPPVDSYRTAILFNTHRFNSSVPGSLSIFFSRRPTLTAILPHQLYTIIYNMCCTKSPSDANFSFKKYSPKSHTWRTWWQWAWTGAFGIRSICFSAWDFAAFESALDRSASFLSEGRQKRRRQKRKKSGLGRRRWARLDRAKGWSDTASQFPNKSLPARNDAHGSPNLIAATQQEVTPSTTTAPK